MERTTACMMYSHGTTKPIVGQSYCPLMLEPLCKVPIEFREGSKSVFQLFTEINPDLSDRSRFIELVAGRLKNDPALVEAWQNYSYEKRVDRGPYLDRTKVGYYERGEFLISACTQLRPLPALTSSFAKRNVSSIRNPVSQRR